MKTLAIESSCDDTSLAIIEWSEGGFHDRGMVTHTQTALHSMYGGVVPELAYRLHAERILPVLEELGGKDIVDEIDCITVTARPGLPGALLVGITLAHTLGTLWGKPVVEVNHIMGHVFSILLGRQLELTAVPYMCLTVSGGHTDIYMITDKEHVPVLPERDDDWIKRQHLGRGEQIEVGPFIVTKLGQTKDDAAGEAFDKVARLLGGPYPGGPRLSQLAEQGGPDERIQLHPTLLGDSTLDVSFSGLKSQVLQTLARFEKAGIPLDATVTANIARAFQEVITHTLASKLCQAVDQYGAHAVGLVGGVAANKRLQQQVKELLAKAGYTTIPVHETSKMVYCTDNAAMIGVVGLLSHFG